MVSSANLSARYRGPEQVVQTLVIFVFSDVCDVSDVSPALSL